MFSPMNFTFVRAKPSIWKRFWKWILWRRGPRFDKFAFPVLTKDVSELLKHGSIQDIMAVQPMDGPTKGVWLMDVTVILPKPSRWKRFWRWVRRQPTSKP